MRHKARQIWNHLQSKIRETNADVSRLVSHPDFDPNCLEFQELREKLRKRIELTQVIERKLREKRIIGYPHSPER